jgi:hypothetical protein
MVAHAKLGASNAHRWLNCPGSVSAEDGIPNTSSPFAEEGTMAHELAETCFMVGSTEPLDDFADQDMADFVRVYVEHVNRLSEGADHVEIEARVSYQQWVSGGFGTSDAVILKGDTLHICDLKYGMGVRVDAEENPQAMLYALGAFYEFDMISDIRRVVIHIVQPRLDHISQWEISISDLLRWAEWVKQRAEEALAEDAPRVPGEKQCRFCRAKASCAALQKMTQDVIMADFDDLDNAPKANTLSDAQMRRALEAKPVIEGWLGAIEGLVRDRLNNGGQFPGYKLVEGRSNRQWEDVEEAEQLLDELIGPEQAFTRKIISPAQAEKVLGKKRAGEIADLIVKPLGAPTLAPESDKRPAINISAGDFLSCADEEFSKD